MNKVCLVGRLTAKPELRYNKNNISYTRITVAVNRNHKNDDGKREADFINCVAWKERAELICKYFDKGSQIGLEGRIQTGKYENEKGTTIYTTDVIIDGITFLDKKQDSRPEPEYTGPQYDESQEESDPFADFGDAVSIEDDNYLE